MKKLLFVIACLLSSAFFVNAQYNLGGNAVSLGGECFRLTESLQSQAGSVWFQNKITLASDFTIESTVNLGNVNSPGADGLAFVLQPVCNGIGGIGGGIGYFGISPSLAVELDTYQNGDRNDPSSDHIGLMANGVVTHGGGGPNVLQGYATLGNLEDGVDRTFKIEWIASTKNLKVTLAGTLLINYTGDIVSNIFGGNQNVFWGFTAATGAEFNNHKVCINSKSFVQEGSFTITKPTCPNYNNGAINLNPAGGIGPFTYAWSNGAATEDVSGLTAGTYTVAVKDNNGCVSNYTILVENEADVTPPVITCPANITVDNDAGLCGAAVNCLAQAGFDGQFAPTNWVLLKPSGGDGNVVTALAPASIKLTGSNSYTYSQKTTSYQITVPCGGNISFKWDFIGEPITSSTGPKYDPFGYTLNGTFFQLTDNNGAVSQSGFSSIPVQSGDIFAFTIKSNDDIEGAAVNITSDFLYINATVTDNCGITNVTSDAPAFFPVGTTKVTYTATDLAGNSSSCSFDVIVNDTEAPTIACPSNISTTNDAGLCGAVVTFPDVTATDICKTCAPASIPGYSFYGIFGGHTYFRSDNLVSWTDAKAAAEALGGHLATVTSAAENAFLSNTVLAWIGLSDAATEGTFAWVNGEPVGYTNWGSGEPNNSGNEDQVEINRNGLGLWNDLPIGFPRQYYVEFDCQTITQTAGLPSGSEFPVGITINTFVALDAAGNTSTCSFDVTVTNAAPTITSVTGNAAPVSIGTASSLTVVYADNNVTNATLNWDDGNIENVANPANTFTTSHTYASPGVYSVFVTLTDACGATVSQEFQYLVVYDPNGGFVTGGGWINSPAGAYVADPTLAGRANFGFVAKYKKGSNVPDGNTEFQYKAGNMNFKSSEYEAGRLVIAGSSANFKGVGTINGAGNYGFLLSAVDGQVNGGGGIDKFRMKIWDKNMGNGIIYDNNIGLDENGIPTTALGGGSIVIHSNGNAREGASFGEVDDTEFTVKVGVNPSATHFTLNIVSDNSSPITLKVHDIMGTQLENTDKVPLGVDISFGHKYMQGIYFAEIKQGKSRKIVKLIKLN